MGVGMRISYRLEGGSLPKWQPTNHTSMMSVSAQMASSFVASGSGTQERLKGLSHFRVALAFDVVREEALSGGERWKRLGLKFARLCNENMNIARWEAWKE